MGRTDARKRRPAPEGSPDGGSAHRRPPSPASPLQLPGIGRLSSEGRFVLLTARLAPPSRDLEAAAELASARGFDWTGAFELACRLWVHPLVARNLLEPRCPPGLLLPDGMRDGLRLAVVAARTRWRACIEAVGPVLEGWAEAGIHPALLKGAALQATLFPPGTRLLNDVDLWVPRSRLEEAAAILRGHGFVRHSADLVQTPEARERLHAWTFHRHRPGAMRSVSVDLHHRLFRDTEPCRMDAAACVRAGSTVVLGGVEVPVFRREDAIVLAAGHLAKDMQVRWQKVADLAVLLGAGPEEGSQVDPSLLEERALEAEAAGPTALALRWAQAAGAPVPPGLAARLERAAPRSRAGAAALLDARAPHPDFRMRTTALYSLKPGFAAGGGGWTPYREVFRRIRPDESQGVAGRTRDGLTWARLIPLVALSRAAASTSAALQDRGAWGVAERIHDLLWPSRRS